MHILLREITDPNINIILEIVGILAGCCTCGASIPQLIKILKSKVTKGVSLFAQIMLFLGNCLWLTYGFIILSPAMIITNSCGTILFLIILVIKIRNTVKGLDK